MVTYDEEYESELLHTKQIHRLDRVWFRSSPITEVRIEQTNECGTRLKLMETSFCPQPNTIHRFIDKFSQLGIYYFSINIKHHDEGKREQSSTFRLAIIVLPEILFHFKTLDKDAWEFRTIVNTNDFIIWEFERTICHDITNSCASDTFQDLVTCHDRATVGKNRRCLAVEGSSPGAFFYSNPGKNK